MEIIVTARELLDKGVWGDYCELYDMNVWAVNEGIIDDAHKIQLTREDAIRFGFIEEE